jgi:hypothetical protein
MVTEAYKNLEALCRCEPFPFLWLRISLLIVTLKYIEVTNSHEMRTRAVRISSELYPYLDAAMEQMRNELGDRLFRYRSEVVSAAVKEFIRNHGVRLEESSAQHEEDEKSCMTGCS